jgi:predicted ATPase/signal transduction histidine kinase
MTTSSFNFQLAGYQIGAEIYRNAKTIVYRADRLDDNLDQVTRAVTIKVLASAYPTDRDLLEFRHQYAIAKDLDLPGVVRHYRLAEDDRGYALVMEDFGGIALDRYVQQDRFTLVDVLEIAIQLADILHAIGLQRIVHKDLKPANILINPVTKQVKLIDFGIACLLPRETQAVIDPHQIEGTLAYLSPEQTGRMNRGIDYRTDFYALGVTLYELLTGKLPFETEDPMELIHCHLAQLAIPVNLVKLDIPVAISNLVAKLMAKNVEDRYQAALGIKYDLEQCLNQYRSTGCVAEFELGDRDLSDRFSIPEQLYGREPEVQVLLDAFARVSAGASELLLVAGHSGIGKTAVINEIHKPIVKQRGYFIKGKFDQFNRNLPFSAFVQAFRDLIGQLLSESDTNLANWQNQILAAVGDNGQVLIEVIPELAKIIGTQPPVAELSGTAAQQRFNWLFQKLIEVFTTPAHPLVMFLDDLQWADSASLQAIELLMGGNGYLLLLGAYRDNEVTLAHPLMLMLDKLQQAKAVISKITLAPLTFADTNQLVANTLHCEIDRATPLTESINLKAHGNPLFITQFLKALHTDGEIWFNPDGYWECDMLKIQSLAITDDVVEFIAIQIQKLPTATQDLLKLAACIGDKFDLEVLSIVSEQSELVATAVWNGLQAGLILPTSQIYKFKHDLQDVQDLPDAGAVTNRVFQTPTINATYCFLHDRVQQAAYSLIPESQRQQTHLHISRLLLANTSPAQQSDRLFEMVNHFNIATRLIQQPDEREMVATLNLLAAQKARAATAYAAAVSYARIGTQLLGKSAWQQQYQLALELYETLAEATFLNGNFDRVPALVNIVLAHAKTPLDRAKAYETIILYYGIQKQYQQAISSGLEILRQLGIKLSPKPDRLTLVRELVHTKIALMGKSNQRLLALPEIVDLQKIARLRILTLLQFPAFFCSRELMAVLSLVGIRLTLRDGNTRWTASFYATYSVVLSSLGELKRSFQIGQLAIMLADRFGDLAMTGRVKVIAPLYTRTWQEPFRDTIPMLDESVRLAIDCGDLQYIGINAGVSIATRFYAGIPLDEIVDLIPKIRELIVFSKDENNQQFFDLMIQMIENLHTITNQPTDIFKEKDELSLVAQWQASNEAILLATMYGFQTLLAYHFEDIPKALIAADAQLPYEYAATGNYSISRIWMYDALVRLAAYPQHEQKIQTQLLKRVRATQKQLGKRARLMPANFRHQYDLVAAEKCRILGNFTTAIDLYDRAISGAKTNEFLQEEALANELAAKFYLAWGKEKIAAVYMQSAYYCYLRWGAKAKTAQLTQKYPQLLAPIINAHQTKFDPLVTLARITDSSSQDLPNSSGLNFDLASVIQSAQVLSSTIDLAELIKQLSQIILQNSGAESCILALPNSEEQWQISRSILVDKELHTTQLPQILTDNIEYPANLIYWIKNTQTTIIFDARQSIEIPDLYLLEHQPQSVFCLPIVKQAQVLGVLYLEHRHAPDLFTTNNKTVVTFLCNQAAIALDNAILYQESQQAAENIRLKQIHLEQSLNDRQVMEVALRKSEERYHQMVSNVPGTLYQFELTADGTYRFNYLSARFSDLFEVEPEAVLADISVLLDRIVPTDRKSFDRSIRKAAKLGNSWNWKGRILTPAGQTKWIRGESRHQTTTDGSIVWDGILVDVTEQQVIAQERTQAEIDLRQSEERYQKLSDNIPGVIYQFRLASDGSIDYPYISSGAWDLFQLDPAAIMADSTCVIELMHPDDIPEFQRLLATSIQNMTPKLWEGRAVLKSGEIKWIKSVSRPELQADSSIVWDGVMLDVTQQQAALAERHLAELALRESEQRYQHLSDNIPGAIYQVHLTTDGQIYFPYMSASCFELFQFSAQAVMADGSCILNLMHPDDQGEFYRSLTISAQNLTPMQWEGRAILATGEIKWLKTAARPELLPDGVISLDGVVLDITDRKQAEAELHQTNQRLELTVQELQRATRLKDEFLATMSHELRTPLNAILGMSEALQEEIFGAINPLQLNAVSTIEQSGEHLLSLINDILDVSKITAGKLDLNITQVSVPELCKSSLMLVRQQAFAKQIQLNTHLPADLEPIAIDERRMRQVLINLINNAVKFTPKGGTVTLSVSIKPIEIAAQTAGYAVCFAISDTGIGIASDDLTKLFQPFIQIDSSLSRKYEGTGLGLVLVKQIVELHGGDVTINSEVGRGSCFTAIIPQTHLNLPQPMREYLQLN